MNKPKLVYFSIPGFFFFIIPLILLPLATLEAYSPRGRGAEVYVAILLALLFALLVAAFVISAFCLLFSRIRGAASVSLGVWLVTAVCFFVGGLVGSLIGNQFKWKSLSQLADRSKPLIAAIESYEKKVGNPPGTLEALVPEFLPAVPSTGFGATPTYAYQVYTNGIYGQNRWVLEVREFGFSTFIYLPRQNYTSAFSHGSVVRRIGDWAYWHQG